jgi:hypothetical protein
VTDVDQVIGDGAQAELALDAGHAFVAAAVQTMSAFEKARSHLRNRFCQSTPWKESNV